MTRIEIKPFLHRNVARDVLPPIPVQPLRRSRERLPEALHLLGLVAAPRRIAGLGQPDLQVRLVPVEDLAHRLQMHVEAAPRAGLAIPGAGEAVEADGADLAEHTALAHQAEPVRIERARAAEHRLEAAMLDPVRRIADHFAEQQPVVVFAPVPVEKVVGLVPEFDMPEMLAIAAQHAIHEIRIVTQPARRAGAGAGTRQRGRRVVQAGQQVEGLSKRRDQPVMPFRATRRLVVRPGDMRPQAGRADRAHAVDRSQYTVMLAGAEPLHKPEGSLRRGPVGQAVHAINPRASSCRRASSPRSVACEPRIQAAASPMVCSSG